MGIDGCVTSASHPSVSCPYITYSLLTPDMSVMILLLSPRWSHILWNTAPIMYHVLYRIKAIRIWVLQYIFRNSSASVDTEPAVLRLLDAVLYLETYTMNLKHKSSTTRMLWAFIVLPTFGRHSTWPPTGLHITSRLVTGCLDWIVIITSCFQPEF